jgi:hypothetical protein
MTTETQTETHFIESGSSPPRAPSADPIRSHCAVCGAEIVGRGRICSVHILPDPEWAAANRAACDLIHRGSGK